jgi:hypothetical protein
MEVKQRQGVVDKHHPVLSISRQCELLVIRLIMLEIPWPANEPQSHSVQKWKGGKRKKHPVHPYRLENLVFTGPNQVCIQTR